MDRSFLSRAEVVAASRAFVCVRLTTYEDEAEGKFLKSFEVTRSGELENTVFTILSPDGRRQLARASRSARHTFGDADRMAEAMRRIARQYPGKPPADGPGPELPRVANVRLALDVAACDNRPLVVLYAPEEKGRRDLETRLASLAWRPEFLGRFIYVTATAAGDLAAIEGVRAEAGVILVQPDTFGRKGKVLAQAGAAADLAGALKAGAARYRGAEKSFGSHVRAGHRLGVFWETVIPVTDPMEQRARERGRNSRRE